MDGAGDEANAADLTDTCLMRLCFLSPFKQNVLMSSSEDVCSVRGAAVLEDAGMFVVISVQEAPAGKQVPGIGGFASQMYSHFQSRLPASSLGDSCFISKREFPKSEAFLPFPLKRATTQTREA